MKRRKNVRDQRNQNGKPFIAAGKGRRQKGRRESTSKLEYQSLEIRQVLAALFPTFVDGVFTLGDADALIPYALEDTFKLSTNPAASKTIYLDFTGHHSINNSWGHDIVFDPYDRDGTPAAFSDAELIEIQKIFQNVAEDFAPFNVNVTTVEPDIERLRKTSASDNQYGVRVVHTQATPEFGGFGGIAFLNSFDASIDDPCFAINKGVNVGAMTISHEVGHTLGLSHDGLGSQAYHPGTGTGTMSWGPIMGAPFSANVTQWSRGEYANSTTTQDDLAIITRVRNGFDFKADDHGNGLASASNLELTSPTTVFDWGIVSRDNDVDVFQFETGTGDVELTIKAFQENPNLDISAELLNSVGDVVATSNPLDDVNAEFNLFLTQGVYYLRIDGVGMANNENNDYGSLGFFTIEGTIEEPVQGPTVIGESGIITDLTDSWKTITLNKSYLNPVVVAGTPSRNGGDPITIRVRKVTSDSFEIAVDEWDYRDGRHGIETVSFMVVEAGEYVLGNGAVLKADVATATHRWTNVNFSASVALDSTPVVLAQISSTNEADAANARIRRVTDKGFQVRVQEEEAADYVHAAESIGYIAITTGLGNQAGSKFEVGLTPNAVTHLPFNIDFSQNFSSAPLFFSSMQTVNGGDAATIRYRSLTQNRARIFLEEERSLDREIAHNPEVVGYLAMQAGNITLPPPAMPPQNAPSAFRVEYRNTNDPERLAAALAIQSSWAEEFLPLDCASADHSGGCGCAGCLGDLLAADSDNALASFVFGIEADIAGLGVEEMATVMDPTRVNETSQPLQLAGAVELPSARGTQDRFAPGPSKSLETPDVLSTQFERLV